METHQKLNRMSEQVKAAIAEDLRPEAFRPCPSIPLYPQLLKQKTARDAAEDLTSYGENRASQPDSLGHCALGCSISTEHTCYNPPPPPLREDYVGTSWTLNPKP